MFRVFLFSILAVCALAKCSLENSFKLDEKCYTFHLNSTNFIEAENICKQNNGRLASFDAENDEFSMIVSGYANYVLKGFSHYWLNRYLSENGSDHSCISAEIELKKWKKESCSIKLPFICENFDKESPFFKGGITEPGNCPHKNSTSPSFWHKNDLSMLQAAPYCTWPAGGEVYKKFNDGCYSLIRQKMTWDAAEAFCVDQGGHLVSIHLPEENNFIINNFNIQFGGAWIGLQLNSDVWKWTDGTEFDCDYWDKDEYPNAKKNKAKIVKTKWWQKDSPITKMYFFCKKPAIP